MKIAVISMMGGTPWGGSEELWATMVEEALDTGHEVVASVYRWPSLPPRIAALQSRGMRVFTRPLPRSRSLGQRVARRVFGPGPSPFQEILRTNPDILLINQGGTYDGTDFPEFLEALYQLARPYVVLCHWGSDWCIPDAGTRELARQYFARASRVAFVSQQNWKTAERQLALALPHALIVRNPVNLADRSLVPWPCGDTVRMASVARLDVKTKGQDILFESLASAPWRLREWRLRLYGEGLDRQYLLELASFYGIAERLDFPGHVKDIRELWSDNHLLVLPSRSEGTPLALVEAMLCGRPCVATDVGGMVDWLEESRTGFIAPAPMTTPFQAALERAWSMRADWQRMGLRAHQAAEAAFDPAPGRSLIHLLSDAAGSTHDGFRPAPSAVLEAR